jgi:lysophospholipase L1-like esterase
VASALGEYARYDDVSVKYITLNPQQYAEADADVRFYFTLPAAPYAQQSFNLFFRISGTLESEMNCWLAQLMRNPHTAGWDIRLIKYAAGVVSYPFRALLVGTPTAMRVKFAGDIIQVFTREGSGDWIPRTPRYEDAHNNTSRGLNLISSDGMTPGRIDVCQARDFDFGLADTERYVLVGDSKSDDSQWDHIFQHQIEQATGDYWQLGENWAVGGYTMAQCAAAIAGQIAAYTGDEPSRIFVNCGANDIDKVALSVTFGNNLRTIIGAILAEWPDCLVYVARPWGIGFDVLADEAAGIIATVVGEYANASLGTDERVFLENGDNGATYMANDKHPNTAGYEKTATEWVTVIAA